MGLDRYWYIACASRELSRRTPLSRQVLGVPLVLFRDEKGQAASFRDRCLHRCGKLSKGHVNVKGHLVCPYHGWSYDSSGQVIDMPAETPNPEAQRHLRLPALSVREEYGYVYLCLRPDESTPRPFSYKHLAKPSWQHLRLVNQFENTVLNCVENFIDVPHTVFTHRGIFRVPELKEVTARVQRTGPHVQITYEGESSNLGTFSWFLNPRNEPVQHTDEYFVPNVTHVTYRIGRIGYAITSQSVPVSEGKTKVYTTIAWRLGAWSGLAAPIVRRQAQKVIDQDIEVLNDQYEVVSRLGGAFVDTEADRIHQTVSELYEAAAKGEDPSSLAPKGFQIRFRV